MQHAATPHIFFAGLLRCEGVDSFMSVPRLVLSIFVFLSVAGANPACSQWRIDADFQVGSMIGVSQATNLVNQFRTDGTGSGLNSSIRIGAAMPIFNFADRLLSLDAGIELGYDFGKFTSDQFTDGASGRAQQFSVTRSSPLVAICPSIGLHLTDASAAIGLWLAIPFASTATETLSILGPTGAKFTNSATDSVVLSNAQILRAGLPFGLAISLSPLTFHASRFDIAPRVFGSFDISGFNSIPGNLSFADAFTTALSFGVGVSLTLHNSRTDSAGDGDPTRRAVVPITVGSQIVRPNVETSPVIRSSKLTAKLRFTLHSQPIPRLHKTVIGSSDTLIRVYEMLPTKVRFVEQSDQLLRSYHELTPAEAAVFGIQSVLRLDPLEVEAEVLNIIGDRMRRDTAIQVRLQFSTTAEQDLGLSLRRMAAIESYLSTKYNLSTTRFHRDLGQPGPATLSANEIGIVGLTEAQNRALFAPLAMQWIERSIALGDIGIQRKVANVKGFAKWRLNLVQGEHRLAKFSGIDLNESSTAGVDLSGVVARAGSDLVGVLMVEDSAGNVVTASDTLQMALTADAPDPTTLPSVSRFVFIADSGQVTEATKLQIIEKLIQVIVKARSVTIFHPEGSTLDRILDESLRLARDRGILQQGLLNQAYARRGIAFIETQSP